MQLSLYLTPLAHKDMEDIWLYGLQQHGQAQSDSYIAALYDCFKLLMNNPLLYPEYREFYPVVRIAPLKEHLVIYLPEHEKLTIIRVLHRRQDVSSHLSSIV